MGQYTAEYFINANDGEFMDFDGAYGAQCVDLFNYYNQQVVGAPWIGTPTTGGAVDLWNDFDSGAGPQFYRKIANTPEGVPQFGDVVIWDQNVPGVTGPAGHVGIFTYGDANSFTSFDENYPTGSACHHQFHPSYKGVLGWLRPLANDPVAAPPAPEPAPVVPETPPAPSPSVPETPPQPAPPAADPQTSPLPKVDPRVDKLSAPPAERVDQSQEIQVNVPANSTMRLPTRDSATGRGIATSLQVLAGVIGYMAVDANFRALVTHFVPWAIPLIPAVAGLVSFLQNLFRENVANY